MFMSAVHGFRVGLPRPELQSQRTRAFVHSRSNTPEPRPVSAHGKPPTGSPTQVHDGGGSGALAVSSDFIAHRISEHLAAI